MTLTALWGHLRRMLAVAHVEVLHLVWDPTTVSLILLVPAIQIVLFGYAINLDPKHVPIAIAATTIVRPRRSAPRSKGPVIS